MTIPTMGHKAEWLERQYVYANKDFKGLTQDQVNCLEVLGVTVSGLYNLHIVGRNNMETLGFNWSNDKKRLDVSFFGSMATFDSSSLTAMIVEAHKRHVRVEISPRTVMIEDEDVEDPIMDYDCDHEEWGWGSCECSVHPRAVINIGLNARIPYEPNSAKNNYWQYHPGVEKLIELTGSSDNHE